MSNILLVLLEVTFLSHQFKYRSSRADTRFDTTVGHIEDIIMGKHEACCHSVDSQSDHNSILGKASAVELLQCVKHKGVCLLVYVHTCMTAHLHVHIHTTHK